MTDAATHTLSRDALDAELESIDAQHAEYTQMLTQLEQRHTQLRFKLAGLAEARATLARLIAAASGASSDAPVSEPAKPARTHRRKAK